uniref:EF-hand domain-containing protein n=1 Tax=Oryza sativa subsp. japonica TaxID=39947 RepID=Q5KQM2_ORYSJ|nr:hypothetical protein [Oryza sativa Japonica Group]
MRFCMTAGEEGGGSGGTRPIPSFPLQNRGRRRRIRLCAAASEGGGGGSGGGDAQRQRRHPVEGRGRTGGAAAYVGDRQPDLSLPPLFVICDLFIPPGKIGVVAVKEAQRSAAKEINDEKIIRKPSTPFALIEFGSNFSSRFCSLLYLFPLRRLVYIGIRSVGRPPASPCRPSPTKLIMINCAAMIRSNLISEAEIASEGAGRLAAATTSSKGRAFDGDGDGFISTTKLARSMADINTDLFDLSLSACAMASPFPLTWRSRWPPFSLSSAAGRRMPSGEEARKDKKRKRKGKVLFSVGFSDELRSTPSVPN